MVVQCEIKTPKRNDFYTVIGYWYYEQCWMLIGKTIFCRRSWVREFGVFIGGHTCQSPTTPTHQEVLQQILVTSKPPTTCRSYNHVDIKQFLFYTLLLLRWIIQTVSGRRKFRMFSSWSLNRHACWDQGIDCTQAVNFSLWQKWQSRAARQLQNSWSVTLTRGTEKERRPKMALNKFFRLSVLTSVNPRLLCGVQMRWRLLARGVSSDLWSVR